MKSKVEFSKRVNIVSVKMVKEKVYLIQIEK